MKLFTNLVTLAVFFVGTYQAVSIVDGNAIVSVGSNAVKFEMKVALPWQPENSAKATPDRQETSLPKAIVIPPLPDAKGTPFSGH
jgi:hypothetical protein